jgi:nucleoside-diphosphate-sugar epimerase
VHPHAAGEVFHVSDGEDVSTPDLIRRIADALRRPTRLFYFPPSLINLAGHFIGRSSEVEGLLGSLVIDISKIRKVLSWKPSYSFCQGLRQTADWYKSN